MTIRIAPHVHSTWSYDGKWTLEALARAFARRGFDAVLLAEHDRGFDERRWREYRDACAAASRGILLVPGIEYSDPDNVVHVPVWGDLPFLGEGRATADVLRDAAAGGGAAVLAHPLRREAWRLVEPEWLAALAAVERWNRKYDGWSPSAWAPEGARAFVALDFHDARQFFPLSLEIASGGEPSERAVVDALRDGRWTARAFGLPVERVARGPALAATRGAERARRPLARLIRAVARA